VTRLCDVPDTYRQLSGYYGQPSFLSRFGDVVNEDGDKLLSAKFQAMMGNIGIIGNFIGLWFAGYGTARWGYRPMYIFGMVLMTAMVFLFVFCQSLAMLIVSQTLVNVPWGIFRTLGHLSVQLTTETLTTAYAAELCPIALRGYLTGFVVMAWNIGQFISSFGESPTS
jgi:SP family general alpha glucoside:H+ symporter-like MFS transporter